MPGATIPESIGGSRVKFYRKRRRMLARWLGNEMLISDHRAVVYDSIDVDSRRLKGASSSVSDYNAFEHFRRSIFAEKTDAFLMLTAYLDDSGTHKDSPVAVVAGYLSTTLKWQAFNKQWQRLLRKYKINAVHMADLEALQGDFSQKKGWTKEKREQLLNDAAGIIARRTIAAIGSAVPVADWEEIMPERAKREFGGPYGWCANQCIFSWAEWRKVYAPAQVGNFIFESGTQGHGQVDKMMNIFLSNKSYKAGYGFNSYGFGNKSILPLQAADMIAYEMYREADNSWVKYGKVTPRYSLALLMQGKPVSYVTYWSREHLINRVKLAEEQTAAKLTEL